MNTPIADFLENYQKKDVLRLHMPGHKGENPHDITEISGADSLYETDSSGGIIAWSEQLAAKLFGAERTCYSAGGSTLAIQAALALLKSQGCRTIAAGRCSHRSLVSAAALLDLDIKWLYPQEYPSAAVNCGAGALSGADALFLTNVDYYGGTCRVENPGIPVICDNAHGAYLKFVNKAAFGCEYLHPMEFGFPVISADSAHKTLPALTGAAYLHFSKGTDWSRAKEMTALFGSSSPSYLILESIDRFNGRLINDPDCVNRACACVLNMKKRLSAIGFTLRKSDPLRITLNAREWGYSGHEFADQLRAHGAECEMSDENYVVLLFSAITTPEDCQRAEISLHLIPRRNPLPLINYPVIKPQKEMSIREAVFRKQKTVPTNSAVGKICGGIQTSCPPCIPIVMPGERIDAEAAEALKNYGIKTISVLE